MEILLYGIVGGSPVGVDDLQPDFLISPWLISDVSQCREDITVRINSMGGKVFDGLALFSALQQAPGKVTVIIDGIAGSIAAVIAMAGDEIVMAENAMMMIHNPAGGGFGEAKDLRQSADLLDKLKDQLTGIFSKRTGLSAEQLSAMLDAETWMSATEALEMKFVDRIAAPERTVNQLDPSKFGFLKVPDHPLIAKATSVPAPAATTQEPRMSENTPAPTPTPTPAPTLTPTPTPSQPVNVVPDVGAAVNAAIAADRARAASIRNEVIRAGITAVDFAETLVNEGVSIEVARSRIIDHIATVAPTITNYRPATIPMAQFIARGEAISCAIANRANPRNQLTDDARAFAGQRLIVLARDWVEATGVNARNMSDIAVARLVFQQPRNAGMHTTSDFPSLLGNTVGRTLRRSYELAPKTFPAFCRQTSVPDFRPVSRVALSDISPMQAVSESGEYQYATVGDSAEQYVVGKWGSIISISWETIINDDLSAFDRLPMAMGQEASQIESDVVYAIVTGNPNMADGLALFEANTHKNLAGAGTAISVAALSAGRAAMRKQKAPKGRLLNLTPDHLVVGPDKEAEANQFTSANFVAAKSIDINPAYNQSLDVVVEARITDLSWILAADPNKKPIDTIEYAYLAGAEGVMIENRQGFEVDGMDVKARLVFGAKAIDYRGLYKNPGA